MRTNSYRGSAEIIPFPVPTRPNSVEPRDAVTPVAKFPSPRAVKVASGSAWYHEAAIQDADLSRKN
jgi:hypothetical protein